MRIPHAYLILWSALFMPACAAAAEKKIPEDQTLASLEQRATEAHAKSQCYVYAQLVHDMVEYGARQYAAGNVEEASGVLKRSQEFARKIRNLVATDTRKVKESEILLRHAAYRLNDLLHATSYEDGPLVQETLAQVNQADTAMMLQVFRK
jgi:hypothetical protein